jgi:hypothetical protein
MQFRFRRYFDYSRHFEFSRLAIFFFTKEQCSDTDSKGEGVIGVINPLTPPKKATSVIATHTRVVSTRKVQFPPAECDYHTHDCNFNTYECDYDTLEWDLNTHSVISTLRL